MVATRLLWGKGGEDQPVPTWDAALYARHSSVQQQWARELIAKLNLRGQEHVLDIGSGDGKVSIEIAAAVPNGSVLGIDNSDDMIRYAAAQYAHVPNLRFATGDAKAIGFREKFDVVFSSAALHWVVDHRSVLRGIAASLRPGGRVLLQMGGKGNAAGVLAAVEHVVAQAEWANSFVGFEFPYGFYGPQEYLPWLAEAGLRAIRVELIAKDMVHADAEAFAGWFRTTWMPWTQRVGKDRREDFVAQVMRSYLAAHPADTQGRVRVAMSRLEVEAVEQRNQ